MHKFSSDLIAPHERFEVWGDFLNRTLAPFRLELAREHPLPFDVEMRSVGELPIVNLVGGGHRATRARPEIARSPEHFYAVSIHVRGVASLTSLGDGTRLASGDVFIIDTTHEVQLDLELPFQHLIVKLPKKWIDARVPRPDLLGGSVLSHNQARSRLFASYINTGFELADHLSPAEATMFAQHSLDLLCEALAGRPPDQPAPSKAWRAAIFVRACRLIALKFSDPDLRPDLLATQLGISTRMLHRIFAEHDATVMRRVLKERISRAGNLLASAQAGGRTISEIAFACGFNDLTHFGRVFCEEVGLTPSQWRRDAMRTPAERAPE